MTVGQYSTEQEFSRTERLMSSNWFRYGSRILILLLFSIIFQSFDMTFTIELRNSWVRSLVFSGFYVLYGLLVWEGAVRLAARIEQRVKNRTTSIRLLILCVFLIIYGMFTALGFGFVYGITDILFFHRYEAWESFLALSYDMNFGTFLFFMMIVAFNGIVFYYKAWKEYQLKTERLMRENIQAKYDALRNQIDPHFFFNSLSVLTNLVYRSADLSADYITQLAKIYRYILDKKFDNLVPVQTELEFLQSYLFLIGIRHQNGIDFEQQLSPEICSHGMLPPATLQMLIENAIKHNRFSANEPLKIRVWSDGHYLYVENNVSKKIGVESSSGIGLENIRKRYELVSGQPITIQETRDTFSVKLPLIE